MHNTDTTVLNSENSLVDEHTEESKDHVCESLENDAPSSGRADMAYGNDLHQAANQLQHLRMSDTAKHTLNRPETKKVIIKDGKIVYPEKKLRMNNHELVVNDMIVFRKFRATVSREAGTGSIVIPESFHTLIALLVQDSDEAITALSTRLNDTLSQFQADDSDYDEPEDEKRWIDALESTIKALASRERYGVSNDVLAGQTDVPNVVPAHLSIYRWEVKDIANFPGDIKHAIERRRRRRMSTIATGLFRTLTNEQQLQLLCAKRKKNSAPLPRINVFTTNSEVSFYAKENHPTIASNTLKISEEKPVDSNEQKKMEELRKIAEVKEVELEEKRKKKEEERKRREDDKRKKDEEKRKKDEERKMKEEEKKKREEEQQKKERSQLRLTSLFKTTIDDRSSSASEVQIESHTQQIFPPFHVKEYVQMASPAAFSCTLSDNFEEIIRGDYSFEGQDITPTVLLHDFKQSFRSELRKQRGVDHNIDLRTLLGHDPSMPLATAASLDGRDLRSLLKMKFLQFREDIRPAYWGTWTKSSKKISPRRPLDKDTEYLDYEHDSEAEWEPEEEGEDIKSGDEEDEDVDIADPDDAGWLVPEGYLSNDEGIGSDNEDEGLQSRTASRRNGPVKQVCIGVIYEDSTDEEDGLSPYSIQVLGPNTPINPFAVITNKQPAESEASGSLALATDKRAATIFPTEQTPVLIDAIKGKAEAMPKLIAEVKAMQGFEDVSKRQIEAKIKTIAVKEKRGTDARPIWYIK
ncbi:hypothetical protein INT43_000822 [Umbelopsis isabellina]|uniref:Chromatin assembly factor 1 subunit A n=1 Tax=Mortierella isabellina TaxID=91625 RepID=A0A8H7Q4I8_MORIS|nr:hypothetical protein INT43_000822 [Umbelopsis isabellina]